MALSWEPARKGRQFCAPACGGKCTWAAHQKAQRDAAALVARLGRGWRPEVWENLGWHWRVVDTTGQCKVHPQMLDGKINGFVAYVGEGEGGRWTVFGLTAEAAIAGAVRKANRELTQLLALLASLAPGDTPEPVPWGRLDVHARAAIGYRVLELFEIDTHEPLDLDPASLVTTELLDVQTPQESLSIGVMVQRSRLARLPRV